MEDEKSSDLTDIKAEIDPGRCEVSITFDTEKPKTKKRKRGRNEDDELIEVLKKKIASEADAAEEAKDEDRHFLLSLLSEIRKVPDERKLKLRSDIISVIATAQRPDYQQWPSHGRSLAPYLFQHPTQYTPSSSYPSSIIHQRVPSQQDLLHRFSGLQTLQNMPSPQQTSMSSSSTLSTDSPAQLESGYVLFE
ncbi:hypothetical protein AVEN_120546-1 [Araneus ventricosus]|uniref:BESS domain-containing protein n=1 Tax=Araneus ventricosus TaxID=182803 RepID=A0A4Y2PF73_ARAVE|nr:hypothetical protein AVEN_120546-1 [Araneus ventricosus]